MTIYRIVGLFYGRQNTLQSGIELQIAAGIFVRNRPRCLPKTDDRQRLSKVDDGDCTCKRLLLRIVTLIRGRKNVPLWITK